jgi:CheY-like chemotaxis protein
MKILIVDDDEKRSKSLKNFVIKTCKLHQDDISLATCLAEARDLLRAAYYDVLVLDVVLPKRKDKKNPHASIGIGLLQELNRSTNLKKPERIIGITAHLGDAGNFRSEFEKSCNIVVEAPSNSDIWKSKIANSLTYTGTSKTSRAVHLSRTAIMSVHGIRTFGQWQARLRKLIEDRVDGVSFHTYKFGYFSSIVFLFPLLRRLQINRLEKSMKPVINNKDLDRIYIFCHSFGTYLVANALKAILNSGRPHAKITLVLCGSILTSTFNWQDVDDGTTLRIVNECGSKDFVLWLSSAFVLGAGMAGKTGFYGFNDKFLMNRFFVGGHSLYFLNNDFMPQQWLPLLDENSMVAEIDERLNSSLVMRITENIVVALSLLKPWLYMSLLLAITYFAWTGYNN